MSKTKNVVDAAANKRVYAEGKFVSQHKKEDIESWLDFKSADRKEKEFEEVFGVEDYDWKVQFPGYDIDIHLNFSEIDEGHHGFSELCEWDEEIQDFLDKEPERNRLQNLNHLRHRIISIKNDFEKLSIDFKRIIGDKSEDSFDELEQQVSNLLDYKKDLVDEEVQF